MSAILRLVPPPSAPPPPPPRPIRPLQPAPSPLPPAALVDELPAFDPIPWANDLVRRIHKRAGVDRTAEKPVDDDAILHAIFGKFEVKQYRYYLREERSRIHQNGDGSFLIMLPWARADRGSYARKARRKVLLYIAIADYLARRARNPANACHCAAPGVSHAIVLLNSLFFGLMLPTPAFKAAYRRTYDNRTTGQIFGVPYDTFIRQRVQMLWPERAPAPAAKESDSRPLWHGKVSELRALRSVAR